MMRKLILICGALFIGALAQAQIQKGDIQLGGTVSFNSNELGDLDNESFSILPQAGLFVSDLTSIGVIIGYNSNSNTVFDQGTGNLEDVKNNLFVFGAYARFHKSVVDNLYLFLQPALRFGTGENEFAAPAVGDINSFNIGLSPGITYFLSPKFAIEMNLGGVSYNRNTFDVNGNETTSNNFNFNLDLASLGLGLNFYIR